MTPGPVADPETGEPGLRELRAFVARELSHPEVSVDAAGPEREIAVVRVPAGQLPRLLEPGLRERVRDRARSAGYRYAAVEIEGEAGRPEAPPSGGAAPNRS